ncbi:PaaI family thioesterase [Rhodococcus jostii]|nr:PaaI family thioesterase [Rhodococcus jostii]
MTTEETTAARANWWMSRQAPAAPVGYPDLMKALRSVQDRISESVPDAGLVADVTHLLREIVCLLEPSVEENEWLRLSGTLDELPGRGQAFIPAIEYDRLEDGRVAGRVEFSSFHLGGNGAAHGGAIPLLFDDVLGRMVNHDQTSVARTANLSVDYRNVTPVGRDLEVQAWIEREEGRKTYARGELWDGQVLCAEARGLFVTLQPGQP